MVTYVRVVDGKITPRERIKMMSTGATHELLEVASSRPPEPKPTAGLGVGEVGYLITGVKDVRQSKVGDTVTTAPRRHRGAHGVPRTQTDGLLGLYPVDGSDYPRSARRAGQAPAQRRGADLRAGDPVALGFGFRIGFLGLLHMEITANGLEREFDLDLISTAPNVVYRVIDGRRRRIVVTNRRTGLTGKVAHRLRAGRQGDDHRAQ